MTEEEEIRAYDARPQSDALRGQSKGSDIVLTVAKMIAPGAFEVWYRGTGGDAKPIPPDTRKKCAQSSALLLASQILKFAAGFSQTELRRSLADSEAAGWEKLGVPVNETPELRAVIDAKYA